MHLLAAGAGACAHEVLRDEVVEVLAHLALGRDGKGGARALVELCEGEARRPRRVELVLDEQPEDIAREECQAASLCQ